MFVQNEDNEVSSRSIFVYVQFSLYILTEHNEINEDNEWYVNEMYQGNKGINVIYNFNRIKQIKSLKEKVN